MLFWRNPTPELDETKYNCYIAGILFETARGLTGYSLWRQKVKVARLSVFVGKPSIFKSLILYQIHLYDKNIIPHVLHIDKVYDDIIF